MEMSSKFVCYVNGKLITKDYVDPEDSLAYFLRSRLRLCGTKIGCKQGGCGACTVMVSKYDRRNKKIRHIAVNACLMPAVSVHGLAVTTVEGIGSTKTGLHPVQERIAKAHGTQCGFCSPGMVMSVYTLLRNNPQPSMKEIEAAIGGNLCRCTGYRPIIEGLRGLSKEFCCGAGENCCQKQAKNDQSLCDEEAMKPFKESQEPIFPSQLQLSDEFDKQNLEFRGERTVWYRPVSLQEFWLLKAKYRDAIVVAGNTKIGLDNSMDNTFHPVAICISHIPELTMTEQLVDRLIVGAGITITEFLTILEEVLQKIPEENRQIPCGLVHMMYYFAFTQIRNVATLGGSLALTRSFSNADVNTGLAGAGCKVTISSEDGKKRVVELDENFFTSKDPVVQPNEIILKFEIPYSAEDEYFYVYKQAKRSTADFATLNAAMKVKFVKNSEKIEELKLVYGGIGPTTMLANKTSQSLIGKDWNQNMLSEACQILSEEVKKSTNEDESKLDYKVALAQGFFFKFFMVVAQKRKVTVTKLDPNLSSITDVPMLFSNSTKVFEAIAANQSSNDSLRRPIPHVASSQHTTGEAKYLDDKVPANDELHLQFVRSTKAHAKILNVDTTEALSMPGVVLYIDHNDTHCNTIGISPIKDEELFATEEVLHVGAMIGAIIADTKKHAQEAALKVKVTYEELESITTIEEAIERKSFFTPNHTLECGDVDNNWKFCERIIENEVSAGSQEHFYMETNCALAIPKGEENELEVWMGSQNLRDAHLTIAAVLGIPSNRVVCKVKRVGGGFGGKESQPLRISASCAVAALKLNQPVRCVLDRKEDIKHTGGRIPFIGKYKVGFSNEGKILCYDLDFYVMSGYARDLCIYIVCFGLFCADALYKIPNMRVTGYVCKANIVTNTAFRGFGSGEAAFIAENMITKVAEELRLLPEQIREKNFYKNGDKTYAGMLLEDFNFNACWQECITRSNFDLRRQEVNKFNRVNLWKKRGIALVPVKHALGFQFAAFNQGGALINIYLDGNVLITHGGVEIGQGLHTKLLQVASRTLEIPQSKIHILETSTETVPNAIQTVGSCGTDLFGAAVLDACNTLKGRLSEFKAEKPDGTWEDWVITAWLNRVNLSAIGFYKSPITGFDWETKTGPYCHYFSYGVGCAEVEIDCLTGAHHVLRVDIVMDVGNSLNPAIDIGQIEGGFMQGYGWCTMEEREFDSSGNIKISGPIDYKIPTVADIPREFNVSLLKDHPNEKAVYSSKGIGEPPLVLGMGVFYALQDAVMAARKDANLTDSFQLQHPATAERIRLACVNQFDYGSRDFSSTHMSQRDGRIFFKLNQ